MTPWTEVCQASLPMEFFRHKCWSGSPFTSSGDLVDPGIEPESLALQADSLSTETTGKSLLSKNISNYWRRIGNILTTKNLTDISPKKNKHFTGKKHFSLSDSVKFNALSPVMPKSRSYTLSRRFVTFQENTALGSL